jgi:hypothetical protein
MPPGKLRERLELASGADLRSGWGRARDPDRPQDRRDRGARVQAPHTPSPLEVLIVLPSALAILSLGLVAGGVALMVVWAPSALNHSWSGLHSRTSVRARG